MVGIIHRNDGTVVEYTATPYISVYNRSTENNLVEPIPLGDSQLQAIVDVCKRNTRSRSLTTGLFGQNLASRVNRNY